VDEYPVSKSILLVFLHAISFSKNTWALCLSVRTLQTTSQREQDRFPNFSRMKIVDIDVKYIFLLVMCSIIPCCSYPMLFVRYLYSILKQEALT